MTAPTPRHRWFHCTPDCVVIGLLVGESVLVLSESFHWFSFNTHAGCTALIAMATVCITILGTVLWFCLAQMLRWRFQFSVRSLLVLTIAVAIPSSWLRAEIERAKKQCAAVATIESVGGEVVYDCQCDEYGISSPSVKSLGPAWMRNCLGDDFFRMITQVRLSNTSVTDVWLEDITCLRQLHVLYLDHTGVTDGGLKRLTVLTNLQGLALDCTEVTDAGMEQLKGLRQLHWLSLNGTKVTDSGLKHLQGLSQLRALGLYEDKVTDEGVRKLKKALPNCMIAH
jgi:hypothetical protein